jgi:DNA replication licensing factor MCM6
MPRSVDVILRHAAVDKAKAGDKCTFIGTLVVVPDVRQLYKAGVVPTSHQRAEGQPATTAGGSEGFTGLKALGVRDLTYRTSFLAWYVRVCALCPPALTSCHAVPLRCVVSSQIADVHVVHPRLVLPCDSSVTSDASRAGGASGPNAVGGADGPTLTQSDRDQVESMSADPDLYRKMVRSVAPTVYGHDEIKRGILLMLLGGVGKETPEGIRWVAVWCSRVAPCVDECGLS